MALPHPHANHSAPIAPTPPTAVHSEIVARRRAISEDWRASDHPIALWLRVQTRDATQIAYARAVYGFIDFLARERGITDPLHARFADVLVYREWLADDSKRLRPLATATIVNKLRALSSLYSHLVSQGALDVSPFAPMARNYPEIADAKFKRAWRVDEIVSFMQQIPNVPNDVSSSTVSPAQLQAARDRALFWLLFRNGLRVSEACGARVGDLYEQDGARVLALVEHGRDDQHIKGGTQRLAVLKPETVAVLDAYLALRGFAAGVELYDGDWRTQYLFTPTRVVGKHSRATTREHTPLSRRTVLYLMRDYGARAGLDLALCHPHAARMTAITHLILAGVDLGSVMIFSGHKAMASVQAYFDRVQSVQRNAAWKMPY